ncbi:ABC transporter ATP-binding protein [Jeotgalibacillus proteolyticus]|uniref:Carnitine transport ATP-binding protein OpuCA n=1 Tax=Jeotgalibacillus proteolyticus TaxID=2082395 RepID=A0A2S5GC04_9BACL|nr:ABC transporter ATP-binding protein [Jeotgalibacillus proteolyticus]PPA70567.1 ABC transporter ATP-binding protein [Jeotgalibacillus proteolyticus]
MKEAYFSLEGAAKTYGSKTIFQSINLSLNEGEILSIVGPSGTGKSTLLRCIAGLESFSSGHANLQGKQFDGYKVQDRPVGMVFQQPLLFPHLTVLENVIYGLKLTMSHRSAKAEGITYLKSVGLDEYLNEYPHSLSGGQQQRIALIRALIVKPKLLLLDEPFSSLDPDRRRELRDWVRMLLKEERMTALFVTHDREESMLLGDKVAILAEGKIQQTGDPKHVYENPVNEYAARHYADAIVLNETIYALNHDVKWSTSHETIPEDTISLKAEWINQTYQYGESYAHVKLVETNRRCIIPEKGHFSYVKPGSRGFIWVKQRDVRLFDKEQVNE